MRLELGNLSLNIGWRMNKIKGCDHIEQYQVTVSAASLTLRAVTLKKASYVDYVIHVTL